MEGEDWTLKGGRVPGVRRLIVNGRVVLSPDLFSKGRVMYPLGVVRYYFEVTLSPCVNVWWGGLRRTSLERIKGLIFESRTGRSVNLVSEVFMSFFRHEMTHGTAKGF